MLALLSVWQADKSKNATTSFCTWGSCPQQPETFWRQTCLPAECILNSEGSYMSWDCSCDFGVQWKPVQALSDAPHAPLDTDWLLSDEPSSSETNLDRLVRCKFCLFLDLSFKIKSFRVKALCRVAYKGRLVVTTTEPEPVLPTSTP